jgi:hypothetical protein
MAEKEIIPESGKVEETKLFIGEEKIKSYEVVEGETTPSGSRIIKIEFTGGKSIKLTEPNFDAVKSYAKGDPSSAQERLVKAAGQKMYALIMEYGPRLIEVNKILDEAVGLANRAMEAANNELWGVNYADERTVLQVNDILAKKYGKETTQNDTPAS